MGKLFALGLSLLCLLSSCSKEEKEEIEKTVLKASALSVPLNHAVFKEKIIILKWKKNIDKTVKYDVFLGTREDLTHANKITSDILDNRLQVKDLKENYTYYWRVDSKNLSEEVASSSVFTFSVKN
jgi:hypothetical protein